MFEDRGSAAYRLEYGSGLHLYRVVDATTVNEGNSAFLDWHWSAFAVEAGEDILPKATRL
jgi:hypothetical protein